MDDSPDHRTTMRVLFVLRSTWYVRNLESTFRLLAERGHRVHVVADGEPSAAMERLVREHDLITHSAAPLLAFNRWSFLGTELRRGIDYLRYLDASYAQSPALRQRAERKAPGFARSRRVARVAGSAAGRRWLARALRVCDRAIPRDPAIDAFVRTAAPDLVVATPLVEPGSPQSDYLRSARAVGIPTALCVYSWDNLTNKGLVHEPLDLVTVWNDAMRDEAIALHGVDPARVVVTGAPGYDLWFDRRTSETADAFRARVGLPAGRPFILYLCSSEFIAPDERPFVRRWIEALRTSPALHGVGILVRPHPQHAEQWADNGLGDLPGVSVWPRGATDASAEASRAEYFDSIAHSSAVVGVNTSAQIESAIIGRGVYTVLAPEFQDTQEGTLHFHHLLTVNGGLLHVARDLPSHVAQLEKALVTTDDDRGRRFVEAFVRPHGIDREATPILVDALEAVLARGRRRPDPGPWWAPILRPALAQLAARVALEPRAVKQQEVLGRRVERQRRADVASRRITAAAMKRARSRERSSR